MTVKKIIPKELPEEMIFRLNRLHHIRTDEFTVIVDVREDIMYINANRTIPQKDTEGFLEFVAFPYYCVNDEKTGMGDFADYVCKEYGYNTYDILFDAHKWQIEQEEKRRAKEQAKAIIPLIEKEVNSENPVVAYNELLAYEIWSAGYHLNRKTPKNSSNYGSVYEFYFGYLMGAGMLEGIGGQAAEYQGKEG